jgi:hypothetical protein
LFSVEPDNDHCDAVLPVEERIGAADKVIFQKQCLPKTFLLKTGRLLFCQLWYLGVNGAFLFPKTFNVVQVAERVSKNSPLNEKFYASYDMKLEEVTSSSEVCCVNCWSLFCIYTFRACIILVMAFARRLKRLIHCNP